MRVHGFSKGVVFVIKRVELHDYLYKGGYCREGGFSKEGCFSEEGGFYSQ